MGVRHIWASAGTHVRIHRRHVYRSPPKYSVTRTIYNVTKPDYSWIWKTLAGIAGIAVVCCFWKVVLHIFAVALFFAVLKIAWKAFFRHCS